MWSIRCTGGKVLKIMICAVFSTELPNHNTRETIAGVKMRDGRCVLRGRETMDDDSSLPT